MKGSTVLWPPVGRTGAPRGPPVSYDIERTFIHELLNGDGQGAGAAAERYLFQVRFEINPPITGSVRLHLEATVRTSRISAGCNLGPYLRREIGEEPTHDRFRDAVSDGSVHRGAKGTEGKPVASIELEQSLIFRNGPRR